MNLIIGLVLATSPTIGFGVGQTLGGHLLTPTLFTMRYVVTPKLVVAPELSFEYTSSASVTDSVWSSNLVIDIETNLYCCWHKYINTRSYFIWGMGVRSEHEWDKWYEYPPPFSHDTTYEVKQTTYATSYKVNVGLGLERYITHTVSVCIATISNVRYEISETRREERGEERVSRCDEWKIDFHNLMCVLYLILYF